MKPIRFGIAGGGWRTEFYLRIARALPERFRVAGIVVRDETKGKFLEMTWRVRTFRNVPAMLDKTKPSFVVTSVPSMANPEIVGELAYEGVPVLSETPPAADLEQLLRVNESFAHAKIQVAEQYAFQPMHAARLAVVRSGRLGTVTQAQISVAHGCHGISLLRKMLGIGFEQAVIQAYTFTSPIVSGPNLKGGPEKEEIVPSIQTVAALHFGDKLGVYDFADDQYFSWQR